jgi:hypothetical protein
MEPHMPRTSLADYRAAAAAELSQAAYYRRSMQRGLMARDIAIPAIRNCLCMAKAMTVTAYIMGQV